MGVRIFMCVREAERCTVIMGISLNNESNWIKTSSKNRVVHEDSNVILTDYRVFYKQRNSSVCFAFRPRVQPYRVLQTRIVKYQIFKLPYIFSKIKWYHCQFWYHCKKIDVEDVLYRATYCFFVTKNVAEFLHYLDCTNMFFFFLWQQFLYKILFKTCEVDMLFGFGV